MKNLLLSALICAASFSSFAQSAKDSTHLPITVNYFTAIPNGSTALISWSVNFKEKSFLEQSVDGEIWNSLELIAPIEQYSFYMVCETNFFRLRNDENGRVTYSAIISARYAKPKDAAIRYYDLTGKALSIPRPGFYIKSQSGTMTKCFQN